MTSIRILGSGAFFVSYGNKSEQIRTIQNKLEQSHFKAIISPKIVITFAPAIR